MIGFRYVSYAWMLSDSKSALHNKSICPAVNRSQSFAQDITGAGVFSITGAGIFSTIEKLRLYSDGRIEVNKSSSITSSISHFPNFYERYWRL